MQRAVDYLRILLLGYGAEQEGLGPLLVRLGAHHVLLKMPLDHLFDAGTRLRLGIDRFHVRI